MLKYCVYEMCLRIIGNNVLSRFKTFDLPIKKESFYTYAIIKDKIYTNVLIFDIYDNIVKIGAFTGEYKYKHIHVPINQIQNIGKEF